MDDEEEWEYEYHDDETEDLYFTLDLTAHVPDAVPIHQMSRNGRRTAKEAKISELSRDGVVGDGSGEAAAQEASSKLEILDLHAHNPLVKLNDKVFSCSWHTDLGTQFYVSEPGATSRAIRPGHVVDVVGVSQTRLLGQPVTLRQRSDWANKHATNAAACDRDAMDAIGADQAAEPSLPPSDLSNLRPGQQLVVPREAIRNPAMAAQASFFEKLSAIKLKKGETDVIPVGAVRQYYPPANKEELRQRAVAAGEVQQPVPIDGPNGSSTTAGKGKKRAWIDSSNEASLNGIQRARQTPGTPQQQAALNPPSSSHHIYPSTATQSPGSTVRYGVPTSYAARSTAIAGRVLGPAIPWHALPANGSSMADLLRTTATPGAASPSGTRNSRNGDDGSHTPG